ncbi:uncharacterized protein LOC130508648 [Raphanus sativus]|uniref:Uncharacterized protein LOC130508648 n=1 Tax=Raphanus sativus TaxID=3726 RepID=A0A9W3D8Y2_RAPSA|nr:uncharacterized protein LOC130508648 [Raphanus sativus]
MSEVNKQLDEIRSSQSQQSEEIRKELGGETAELKAMISQILKATSIDQTQSSTPKPTDPTSSDHSTIKTAAPPAAETHPPLPHVLSSRLTKVGFTMFDGTELKEWIYRCEQFFSIDNTSPELKVRLAALHLTGKALQWHHGYITNRYNIYPLWPDYISAISSRFGELYYDPLAELVSLKQSSDTIDEYLEKFDSSMTRLTLPPEHALSIFLTNMNQHLAFHVRQFNVTTVPEAARIAKFHDLSLQHAPVKSSRPSYNSYQKTNSSSSYKSQPATTPATPNTKPLLQNTNQKRLTFDEMQERKRKGLCMFCEEPFTPGHQLKHKRAQILYLETENEDSEEEEDIQTPSDTNLEDTNNKTPTISVHALNGSPTYNCMRIIGQYGKRKLHILIDPGSTHNFLDLQVAKTLGCNLTSITPMPVAAASGDLITNYKCSDFVWKTQGYEFKSEVRTLRLGFSDLVLGVQWLSTLGPILWDFLNLRMEFKFNGLKHVLRGITPNDSKIISSNSLNKLLLQEPQLALLHLRENRETESPQGLNPEAILYHIEASNTELDTSGSLQRLIESYSDIFDDPTELPPFRQGFNHKIPLESGANPVNLRP